MGNFRHRPRWHSRQTRVQLVWQLDNLIQPFRRCHPLLPSQHHFKIQTSILIRNPSGRIPSSLQPKAPRRLPNPDLILLERLHLARHLHQPIRLLRHRDAKVRPAPRLAPPLRQVGLGI